ncbi:MAG: ABC transporter ATP-binding protein [Patescibacteria group bacterium]
MEFPAIKTINLSKQFDHIKAVNSVNLEIQTPQVYALIGPNGSGKTTLIKLLVGLLRPTHGSVSIFGHDILQEGEKAKEMFGYISDDPSPYDYLSGIEFLTLTGKLRRLPSSVIHDRISELLSLFPIQDIVYQRMGLYSRGNRQKLAFLAAFIAQPRLLIIDEPIVGLDPTSIDIFGKALKTFARNGGTVFFATHILSFAKRYADRVGIMHAGRIAREENISLRVSLDKWYGEEVNKSQ